MPQFGWVKNHSQQEQSWGRHSVAPQGVGMLPIEVIQTLRDRPLREIEILSDDPKQWVFQTTPHEPFSPRFRND
jgi:hypothetical protein